MEFIYYFKTSIVRVWNLKLNKGKTSLPPPKKAPYSLEAYFPEYSPF